MKAIFGITFLFLSIPLWRCPADSARNEARLAQPGVNEKTEVRVNARQFSDQIDRLERLVNHLGGRVLTESSLSGNRELVVQIPEINVSYFRDHFDRTTRLSNAAAGQDGEVFQVVVIPAAN